MERVLRVISPASSLLPRGRAAQVKAKYGRIVNIASIAGKEAPDRGRLQRVEGRRIRAHQIARKGDGADRGARELASRRRGQDRDLDQMTKQHIDYMLSEIPMSRFVAVRRSRRWCAARSEDCSFHRRSLRPSPARGSRTTHWANKNQLRSRSMFWPWTATLPRRRMSKTAPVENESISEASQHTSRRDLLHGTKRLMGISKQ